MSLVLCVQLVFLPRVLQVGRVMETHLTNAALVAKTFSGVAFLWVYPPMSLFSNINSTPTKTNAMETVEFFWFQIATLNITAFCLISLRILTWAQVDPLNHSLITKMFMNLTQKTKSKQNLQVLPEFQVCLLWVVLSSSPNAYKIKHFVFTLQMTSEEEELLEVSSTWCVAFMSHHKHQPFSSCFWSFVCRRAGVLPGMADNYPVSHVCHPQAESTVREDEWKGRSQEMFQNRN